MKETNNFFSQKNTRKQIIILFGILFSIQSILSSISYGISKSTISKIFTLIVLWSIVIFLFLKLKNKYLPRKDEFIRKFEIEKENIGIIDAFIYSIISYKEIFLNIPQDRKRIVNISFILIGIAMFFLYLQVGNFISIVSALIVIFAAILILVRVLTLEREERSRLQNELSVARDMQMSLMPKESPDFHNFDIYGFCKPAKIVGGDFFDFHKLDENRIAISIADVSGKGLDAAMTTLFISGALASELKYSKNYSDIVSHLNTVTKNHCVKGKFISFLLTVIDYESKRLYYINAGQPKPIVKRNEQILCLDYNGIRLPLGALNGTKYEVNEFDILNNDLIIFYTDGVSEAMNSENDIYGSERLIKKISELPTDSLNSKEICDNVYLDLLSFCNPKDQHDDITMITIKIKI